MRLIVDPVSIVDVTVRVLESTLPVRFIFAPFAFIGCSVVPVLLTETMPVIALPLATIDCAIFETEIRPLFDLLLGLSSIDLDR